MNKFLKNITFITMSTILILSPFKNVKADNLNDGTEDNYSYISEKRFDKPIDVLDVKTVEDNLKMTDSLTRMTNDQLNEVINYVADNDSGISTYASNSVNDSLKVAWKAAAQIAINSGYPLAGTLVIYSVDGVNYYEQNGAFSQAIKGTNVYKRIQSGSGSDNFTTSDSKDLYYAIHAFKYHNSKTNKLYISDTFDFALNTDYQNTFSTLVNNWGYLNQKMEVLTPISVDIEMQK